MPVHKLTWLSALAIFTLLLSACGASNNEATIATAVALTVQAQTLTTPTSAPQPTSTLPAGFTPIATLTNIVPTIQPTTTAGGNLNLDCAKASLVGENYPDGTIFYPEETFIKTWQIKNESNCTWNTSYRIVYWNGELMGGAYYYNLPQPAGPGQVIDIPLQLNAPAVNGNYKGEWKLQTPDGINFGVGPYSEPFFVDIVVSDATKPEYGISSVTYRLVREPASGCATNVYYYVYATISANGPTEVRVQWIHSDGDTSTKIKLVFTEAGSQELMDGWSFHLGDSPGDKWIQLVQTDPARVEFDKVNFSYLCK